MFAYKLPSYRNINYKSNMCIRMRKKKSIDYIGSKNGIFCFGVIFSIIIQENSWSCIDAMFVGVRECVCAHNISSSFISFFFPFFFLSFSLSFYLFIKIMEDTARVILNKLKLVDPTTTTTTFCSAYQQSAEVLYTT